MQNKRFIRALVKFLPIFLCMFSGLALRGQWQEMGIGPSDSVALGNKPMLPESLTFYNSAGEPVFPHYTFKAGQPSYLLFDPPLEDSLRLRYQQIDLQLPLYFSLRDTNLILPQERARFQLREEELSVLPNSQNFSPFRALNSQGSLSRSISVGSNQDAVLNSALNLQLSGDLGNQTQIRASISDNTVPVQAEGYTQQLRDFDRVYLELENPDFGLLRAGDYNIKPAPSTYLNFEKRVSGGGLLTAISAGGEKNLKLQAEGGLARGRFARNRFQGQEGNQGPYKLQGANGEQFIIIVSGSERVYIDGILLKRGQQYDYVIDYNAGEITFTALQPITRDKRIVVEFQYTEQNYLRSVLYGESSYQSQNWQNRVQYYTEQDSKDQALGTDLSNEEKAILAAVGDDLERAFASTIRAASYDPGLVQYRLIDSLAYDSVLVFSTDSSQALFNASFAFVGAGKGDYKLVSSNANGRVFQWVEPQNGQSQGSYAPVRTLVAPNRLQVLNWQSQGQFGRAKNQSLNLELAASNNRLNLFSDRDRSNDDGLAGKLEYAYRPQFKKGKAEVKAAYQFNNPGFTTVERIYAVEFARDWNLPLNYQGALQTGALAFRYFRDSLHFGTEFQFLNSPLKEGFRQSVDGAYRDSSWITDFKISLTQTQSPPLKEQFLREQIRSRYYWLDASWFGFKSIGEWNRKELSADSLSAASYSFLEYQVFQGFGDTNRSFMEFGFLQRFDDSVRVKDLQPFTYAYTFFGRGHWRSPSNGRLSLSTYYRNLQILQPEEQALQRSLTSRLDYQQAFIKGALRSQTFYESGSGTEPRRSFTYIEVPAGTGTHTHVDYNGNGIRELDEFEIAPSPDLANFVRVFSPNLEFFRTSIVKLGQSLNIQAPRTWQSAQEGYRAWLRKFSLISSYQLERKTLLEGGFNELNPFSQLRDDTLLVSENNAFRQSLFYNRSALGFGADYNFNRSSNRNLLSFGIEERVLNAHRLGLRYAFDQAFVLRYQGNLEDKRNRSGNFASRNFDLQALANTLSLSYQEGQKLTLTGAYELRDEQSSGADENSLAAQEFSLNLNYNLASEIAMQGEVAYIRNNFEGDVNSPAAFEMLQAFKPGDNLAISLTLQRTFLKNIVLSLNYSGRFSREAFAIHTGNLQVKAFL